MHNAFVRRGIHFLLFATVLVVAWPSSAAGAPRESILSSEAGERMVPELFKRLWSLLRRAAEGKEGCNIDPWGRSCVTKDGCHIDPNGRGTPAQSPEPQRKDGCRIDPFGRCLP